MTLWQLVLRGLRHYWRTHLGVLIGSAIATATLVGALLVGDSVRASLRARALDRIGLVDASLFAADRSFGEDLAKRLAREGQPEPEDRASPASPEAPTGLLAPALLVRAVLSAEGGAKRLHDVRVFGVDERFFALGGGAAPLAPPADGQAYLGQALAHRLQLASGAVLVLRIEKPSALPRDMALSSDDVSLALTVRASEVIGAEQLGAFALDSEARPPANVFVPLRWLQEQLELSGRANLLLASGAAGRDWNEPLRAAWQLDDGQLELLPIAGAQVELSSSRIFFDEAVLQAAGQIEGVAALGVFTYFVNELRVGERSIPYSMVSGLGALGARDAGDAQGDQAAGGASWRALCPDPANPDGIVLNSWAALDLDAQVGDSLELRYFVVDPSRRLVERTRTLRVERVVPIEGLAADSSLMPAFPGLADADNCRDWEPGTPVDLERIRDVDERYWDEYRGTPKAFVSLACAREMWSSRFGALTALRFAERDEARLRSALRATLEPSDFGLYFRDLRASAIASGDSPTDFSGLFIGLSFFLIVSSLLLATQLFLFGVEQRSAEIGLLTALGFTPARMTRLFVGESLVLASAGGALGALAGLAYTRAILWGLGTIWKEAVFGATIRFHASPTTVLMGLLLALLSILLSVAWAGRRLLRLSSHRLLSGESLASSRSPAGARKHARRWKLAALLCALGALAIFFLVDPASGPSAAGAFFGAGTLALIGALALTRNWVNGSAFDPGQPMHSLFGFALRNLVRKPARSQATIALMGIGSFLVLAVGANRIGPTRDEAVRSSGTGGFALFGQSSLPLVRDLASEQGRRSFGLDDALLRDVAFVPLRVRDGDDASCLSLARASAPTLLGVDPRAFAEREAFPFASAPEGVSEPWLALDQVFEDGAIPAIGDITSLRWQLHKAVGDTLDYTDEFGKSFQVRVVGALADTILQGDLLIAEARFEERFPSTPGHRALLVDVAPERAAQVSAGLSRALADLGMSFERTGALLDAFHSIQNTYLTIFEGLGALGLLLGSVGLGMVVLRNTLERRSEIGLLSALGFRGRRIRRGLLIESGSLLSLGLGVGVVSALVTVVPAMRAPGSELSLTSLLAVAGVVAANGLFWILLAGRIAWRGARRLVLSEE